MLATAGPARACRIRRRRPAPACLALALLAVLAPAAGQEVPTPAAGQERQTPGSGWFVEFGLGTGLTLTDNANFSEDRQRDGDAIVDLSPSVVVRGEGRRLRVAGSAVFSGVTYVQGTRTSSFEPSGWFNANLEAIERWFFVDAGLSATRQLNNPLAPRPDGPSSYNRLTTTAARLSPYIQRALPNDIDLLIRSDNLWTDTHGGTLERESVYVGRHRLVLERDPRRFGWAVEAERTDQRSDGDGVDLVPPVDLARVRLRYALSEQLAVGLRGGYERSELFIDRRSLAFGGAELSWRPTERTRLDGFWEDRSYGSSWELSFTHRSPFVAWNLASSRGLTSFSQSLMEIPATGDLSALLDAALQTRIDDPIARARAVQDFIARRGLPRSLPGPVNVFSDEPLVRQTTSATIAFIGVRSTLSFTGYRQHDAPPEGDDFVLTTGLATRLKQHGGSVAYSLQLNRRATAIASASYMRVRDLSGASILDFLLAPGTTSASSRQQTYRLQYDYQLSARTTGFVGGRHQRFRSDFIENSRENAVFGGLAHRF